MDKLEKHLTGKLKLLKFTFEKTSEIVSKANIVAIERQRVALLKITANIEEVKLRILEGKFERGDNDETITNWSKNVEEQVENVDAEVEKLQKYLDEMKANQASKAKEAERAQQLQFEKEQYEQKLHFEHKKRLKHKRNFGEEKAQRQGKASEKYDADRMQLNLQRNQSGLLECRGRFQGHYPIYLPDTEIYTEKFVQQAHEDTLHGEVGLTMAKVRENHWVPRLRQLAKRLIKKCPSCKRFQITALASPPSGFLPKDRTEGNTAFFPTWQRINTRK
ncbi:Hypothetical predicted protein [Paramuricea clavata]|uniref:Uncharacterized protein n=1 Tax=Paramuricea clavata TaxID=317549 RepID=A0A6S7FK83_PARCT|nr:Hypothetical predicted protein [Paramuricea clavata]